MDAVCGSTLRAFVRYCPKCDQSFHLSAQCVRKLKFTIKEAGTFEHSFLFHYMDFDVKPHVICADERGMIKKALRLENVCDSLIELSSRLYVVGMLFVINLLGKTIVNGKKFIL